MKSRTTGPPWTSEEKRKIKLHLVQLSRIVPALTVFMLPFGSLLLPFLAEVLDRRKLPRGAEIGQRQIEVENKGKQVQAKAETERKIIN
jgi:hypothetical protein